jgi:uncharacterized membrane protein
MSLQDFLDYFLNPTRFEGYDLPRSLTYIAVFLFCAYIILKLFKKNKLNLSKELILAVIPYIFLGSLLRVLRDLYILDYIFLTTPYIYLFVSFIFSLITSFSFLLDKKLGVPFPKVAFIIGVILIGIFSSWIKVTNYYAIFLVFFPFSVIAVIVWLIKWSYENKLVVLSQIFDGIVTSIAVTFFGYSEQHFIPRLMMFSLHPIVFPIVKLLIVALFLIIIDKSESDRETKKFVKLIIGGLGLATGTRDFLCLLSLCFPH